MQLTMWIVMTAHVTSHSHSHCFEKEIYVRRNCKLKLHSKCTKENDINMCTMSMFCCCVCDCFFFHFSSFIVLFWVLHMPRKGIMRFGSHITVKDYIWKIKIKTNNTHSKSCNTIFTTIWRLSQTIRPITTKPTQFIQFQIVPFRIFVTQFLDYI